MSETMKQKVKTDFEELGFYPSQPGSEIAPVLQKVYDEEQKREVVKIVDHFNVQKFIDSSAALVDMSILKQRALALGESAGVFVGDIDESLIPENIHDLYKLNESITSKFNELEGGLQNAFGSLDNYRNAIIDGTAFGIARNYYEQKAAAAVPEEGGNK